MKSKNNGNGGCVKLCCTIPNENGWKRLITSIISGGRRTTTQASLINYVGNTHRSTQGLTENNATTNADNKYGFFSYFAIPNPMDMNETNMMNCPNHLWSFRTWAFPTSHPSSGLSKTQLTIGKGTSNRIATKPDCAWVLLKCCFPLELLSW